MSMRKIYRKLAKKHGVSVSAIKSDMQNAIHHAYSKSSKTATEKELQERISGDNKIPSVDEFIEQMIAYVGEKKR